MDSKHLYYLHQTEEFCIQSNINRFHNRRYDRPYPNSINSVTAQALAAATSTTPTARATPSSGGGGGAGVSGGPTSPGQQGSTSFFDASVVASDGQQSDDGMALNNNTAGLIALTSLAEGDLLQSVDNSLLSVLSRNVKLSTEFKQNYEKWLEQEVYHIRINWDELLNP